MLIDETYSFGICTEDFDMLNKNYTRKNSQEQRLGKDKISSQMNFVPATQETVHAR